MTDKSLNRSATASLNNLRSSPQKVNLVLQMIRGMHVAKALKALKFCNKAVAQDVYKVLFSAISNAENNYGYNIDQLYVVEAIVGKGTTLKRFQARAKGRPSKIRKLFSQVKIVVSEVKEAA